MFCYISTDELGQDVVSELRGSDFKSDLIGGFVGHWVGGRALMQFSDQILPQMMVVGLTGELSTRASGGIFGSGTEMFL